MSSKQIVILVASLTLLISAISWLHKPQLIAGSTDVLGEAEIVPLTGAVGPESLALDQHGRGPYTGVADGRILRWDGRALGWSDFAFTSSNRTECVRPFAPEIEHICGRPLGLRFHKKTGELYIADAYLGLTVVNSDGGLATALVSEVDGKPLVFTNDMDIDEEDDAIYFTDSSTVYQRRDYMSLILSGDKTGRLLKYNVLTKEVTVLLQGLAFANGVALSQDRSFVLVAETTSCRIQRLWLRGPKAGKSEVFAELPGSPDNVRRNSRGEFWVALTTKETHLSHIAVSFGWVGNMLLRLPLGNKQLQYLLVGGKPHVMAIKLDEEGKILHVLEDCEGKALKSISEVEEKGGRLWFGSVLMPVMGIFTLS